MSESRPKWLGRKVGHPIPNFQNETPLETLKLKHKPQTKVKNCVYLSHVFLFIQLLAMVIRSKTSDWI